MSETTENSGYFNSGLAYNRFGHGPGTLVVFQGLVPENKPMKGLMARLVGSSFKGLADEYTSYLVTRKQGLPEGYSMRDMAKDYAAMVREEFDGPVDVMGLSSGGPMAQHFAVDNPDLVRRLVLAYTAYKLGDDGKVSQRRLGVLARQGKWRTAYSLIAGSVSPPGLIRPLLKGAMWMFGKTITGAPSAPSAVSDFLVTIEAGDAHDFKDRLAEISVPTLVIGGDQDFYFPAELYRETAKGIANAKLILYEGATHTDFRKEKQFAQDVLAFLTEDN